MAEQKFRIVTKCKVVIRPDMTYTAETQPDTLKIRQLFETTETRLLPRTPGKTLIDGERNENVTERCKVKNVND